MLDKFCSLKIFVGIILICVAISAEAKLYSNIKVSIWNSPYGSHNPPIKNLYDFESHILKKKYKICVSLPRDDGYWSLYKAGLINYAKHSKIKLDINNSMGLKNIDIQKSQIKKCAPYSDAIIVASISYNMLSNLYRDLSINTPIIALAHDLADLGIHVKTVSNFEKMGFMLGEYLKKHFKNSKRIRAVYLPGQLDLNWVDVNEIGLKKALKSSNINIIETRYGDFGIENQKKAVEAALHKNQDKIELIIANAFAAEAAVELLKKKNLHHKIKVVSTFISPKIHELVKKREILAVAYDSPTAQAKIALDQTIRLLEGKRIYLSVIPVITILDSHNIDR